RFATRNLTLTRHATSALGGFPAPAASQPGAARLLRLGAVLGPALLPTLHAAGIQRPAHDVVAHPRQVLDAAAADEHDRVLLQIVPLAGDVAGHLDPVREPDARYLAERRIRLLGRGRVHARAHPALLRARLERRSPGLALLRLPP